MRFNCVPERWFKFGHIMVMAVVSTSYEAEYDEEDIAPAFLRFWQVTISYLSCSNRVNLFVQYASFQILSGWDVVQIGRKWQCLVVPMNLQFSTTNLPHYVNNNYFAHNFRCQKMSQFCLNAHKPAPLRHSWLIHNGTLFSSMRIYVFLNYV